MQKFTFSIYADFETFYTKVESCEPNKGTEIKTIHEPTGFYFVVVSPYYPTSKRNVQMQDKYS